MSNSIKAPTMSSKVVDNQKEPYHGNKNQWKCLKLIRLLFHPALLVVTIMFCLIALKTHQFVGARQRIVKATRPNALHGNPSTTVPPSGGGYIPSTIISKPRPETERSRRVKRDDDWPVNEWTSMNTTRPIPLTALDDMIIDADTPLPASQCIGDALDRLQAYDDKQRASRTQLSEHGENCTSNDDCLLLSPYIWDKGIKGGEMCRKPTYLRCNVTEQKCLCQDKFDLRWDTYTNQSTYQWNPITKTCYVRATNPCKHEVPCAPGTTCRATVSISYNTPPIQRICECSDIKLIVSAGNEEWWYCKKYFQRTWFLHVDNINMREHRPFHIYARLTDENVKNTTLDEPKAGAGERAGSEGM